MPDAAHLITMRGLGTYGQWGNQVFQYAFVRAYAGRFGLDYQVPAWAGQHFFGHADPPIDVELPEYHERYAPCAHESCFGEPIPPAGDEVRGHDWVGWGQFDTCWYLPDERPFVQELFIPRPDLQNRMDLALQSAAGPDRTIIALHLRRGDGGRMIFFWTPIVWCLRWLRENWARFHRPVLYMATEDVSLARWFARYGAITMEDLGFEPIAEPPPDYRYPHQGQESKARQLSFFPDWYVLQHAHVVLAAESTFSVSAAWTGLHCREFWRPRLSLGGFERVDPWNTCVSPREHLDDFPGIPGTQIDANPEYAAYWGNYRPRHPSVAEDLEEIERWMDPP